MVIPKPSVTVHDTGGCGVCGSTKSHTHTNWAYESVLIRGNQATRKAETARRIKREKG